MFDFIPNNSLFLFMQTLLKWGIFALSCSGLCFKGICSNCHWFSIPRWTCQQYNHLPRCVYSYALRFNYAILCHRALKIRNFGLLILKSRSRTILLHHLPSNNWGKKYSCLVLWLIYAKQSIRQILILRVSPGTVIWESYSCAGSHISMEQRQYNAILIWYGNY